MAYVGRLKRAGYRVSLDPFDFADWESRPDDRAVSPEPKTWVEDTDYIVSQFSAAGDVTGEVFVAGNTVVPPGRAPR